MENGKSLTSDDLSKLKLELVKTAEKNKGKESILALCKCIQVFLNEQLTNMRREEDRRKAEREEQERKVMIFHWIDQVFIVYSRISFKKNALIFWYNKPHFFIKSSKILNDFLFLYERIPFTLERLMH